MIRRLRADSGETSVSPKGVGIGGAPAASAPSKGRHLAGNERLLCAWARGELTRAEVEAELDRQVAEGGRAFWYLATPYSGFRGGPDAAFRLACETAAALIRAGVPVYSPIAQPCPIALAAGSTRPSRGARRFAVAPMMEMMGAASGLLLLTADGRWNDRTVAVERGVFEAAGKPVVFLEPGEVGQNGVLPMPAWLRRLPA